MSHTHTQSKIDRESAKLERHADSLRATLRDDTASDNVKEIAKDHLRQVTEKLGQWAALTPAGEA